MRFISLRLLFIIIVFKMGNNIYFLFFNLENIIYFENNFKKDLKEEENNV